MRLPHLVVNADDAGADLQVLLGDLLLELGELLRGHGLPTFLLGLRVQRILQLFFLRNHDLAYVLFPGSLERYSWSSWRILLTSSDQSFLTPSAESRGASWKEQDFSLLVRAEENSLIFNREGLVRRLHDLQQVLLCVRRQSGYDGNIYK